MPSVFCFNNGLLFLEMKLSIFAPKAFVPTFLMFMLGSATSASAQYQEFTPLCDTSGRSDQCSIPVCEDTYLNPKLPGDMECYSKKMRAIYVLSEWRMKMAK